MQAELASATAAAAAAKEALAKEQRRREEEVAKLAAAARDREAALKEAMEADAKAAQMLVRTRVASIERKGSSKAVGSASTSSALPPPPGTAVGYVSHVFVLQATVACGCGCWGRCGRCGGRGGCGSGWLIGWLRCMSYCPVLPWHGKRQCE